MNIQSVLHSVYYSLIKKKKRAYIKMLVKRGLQIGSNVKIIDTFFFDPSHCFLISIGDNSTICPNVRLIAHDASSKKILGYTKIGMIEIGSNCFIGDSTVILPNVHIGTNSIIGAGSVVVNSIPPDTVAAGNPARVICSVEEYYNKIKLLSQGKKIFDKEYKITNLNEIKRFEIMNSVKDSIGFIV